MKGRMLEDTPINDKKEEKKRRTFVAIIAIICSLSIIITMIIQIKQLEEPEEPVAEPQEEIQLAEFNALFNNKLESQGYSVNQSIKNNIDYDVIYNTYQRNEKVEKKYEINVSIPEINLRGAQIEKINKEIKDIFQLKAENIISNEQSENIIYTVEYSACLNSNILSLVIKSTLKEGKNAQRMIVKGYTYNISTGEILDIEDIIAIRQLDKSKIKKEINKVVEENAKQNETLINLGYNVYKRDLKSSMYEIENIDNFYYGPNGGVYIIFAYGNNNFTSETDIVPIG